MSTNPLYVTDIQTLKRELRLTGVPANSDVDAIILQALAETRVTLVDRLGTARVAEIKAYTSSANPATANEYMRMRASLTETMMCRAKLMRKLPIMFREGASTGNQTWNEVGIDRDMGGRDLSKEITRLEAEIEENIIAMGAGENDNVTVRATVIGPTCSPTPYPGSAVFG